MSSRTRVTIVAALCLLVFTGGPIFADRAKDRAEAKARKKAWEEAEKAFKAGYKSEDPKRRRSAVMKLRDFTDMGAGELVVEMVLPTERNFGVIDAAIRVLGSTKDPKMIDWLVGQAKGRGKWVIRASVVESLADVESPEVDATLDWLLEKEKDSRVLSMALFAVAEKHRKESIDLVIPLLEHDDWQVRVAAIEALAAMKLEKAIPHLIDRLMNERGRLRQDINQALKSLTGMDFGRDANAWRKWFHERDPNKPIDPEAAKPAERKPDGMKVGKPKHPGGSVVKEPTYFGIKVISDRVLFIIDVSMSMKTPIDIDKMKLMRDAATTGDAKSGENKDDEKFEQTIQWWKIKDRLDLAKAHLQFVIKNLGKAQAFEIVAFSDTVSSYNTGRLLKATTRNKLRAVNWVAELKVEGATAAGAVLDFAFEMAGPGAADKNYKTGVDTIFFLSDGAPSDRSTEEILEEVRARNRMRKIKIHVVAILNYSTKFLELLAKQNGGIYKFFKVEDKK